MPVKKRGKKKRSVAKRSRKKSVVKHVREHVKHVGQHVKQIAEIPMKMKVHVVLKNLLLFGVLFVLSVLIASFSSNELIDTMFWFLAWLTAFVAVAFLIILLILLFVRQFRK